MRLAERVEEITVALQMFPYCVRCGRDLSALEFRELVMPVEHPRRFACKACPAPEAPPHAA